MEPFDGVYPELDEGLRTGSTKSRKREQGTPNFIRATI
jgi:hypothetical protein